MQPSERVLDLIRVYEGLRLTAYLCPAGRWTIGYGHTKSVVRDQVCTKQEAEMWLREDVASVTADLARLLGDRPMKQGQYDALVDFVFNFGATKFERSKMYQLLIAGYPWSAYGEFARWVYDGAGTVLPGLVKRRRIEKAWWAE